MEERDSCPEVGTRQGALTTRELMSAHELPTHDHHSRSLGTRYPGKSKPPKVEDSRARALALCPEIQARRRVSVSRCQIQTHSTINYLDFLWVVWHVFLRDSGGSGTSSGLRVDLWRQPAETTRRHVTQRNMLTWGVQYTAVSWPKKIERLPTAVRYRDFKKKELLSSIISSFKIGRAHV